jgi:hypothetical protein
MINEFNYLTLRELCLIRIRHFDYLDAVQKFKVMWAIDRAKKIMEKAWERKLNFNFYSDKNTDVYLNSKGEAEHM